MLPILESLFAECASLGASDIHLTTNQPPRFRVQGQLAPRPEFAPVDAQTVDDIAMGVTEVVRGDDLLPATPPQILLYQALGLPVPAFFHVPLVVGPDGRRLARRHGDTRIASFRESGVSPERLIGFLARSLGLIENERPIGLRSLIGLLDPARIPRGPLVYQGLT